MTDKPATDKPLFSIKDLFYFLTIIGGFFVSYNLTVSSLKLELHDAIAEINYNKKETDYKFSSINQVLSDHSNKINALTGLPAVYAVKPKELKIESE